MIQVVHPGSGSLLTHPGSRGQKGTGSRIRNTSFLPVLELEGLEVELLQVGDGAELEWLEDDLLGRRLPPAPRLSLCRPLVHSSHTSETPGSQRSYSNRNKSAMLWIWICIPMYFYYNGTGSRPSCYQRFKEILENFNYFLLVLTYFCQ